MNPDIFRVLHTADWHLGKTLHDHDRMDEHVYFLDFLLKTIKEKEVDTLIIAGDVFDSVNPPPYALRIYYDFLADVYHTTKCAVVVTSGNHDSPAQLEAPKDVLKALNIHVVGTIPENIEDALILLPNAENPSLAIAALPFLRDKDLRKSHLGQSQDEIRKNIQDGIQKRYHDIAESAHLYQVKGVALIATGHLTVLGGSTSESERDNIHIGGLGIVNTNVFPNNFSYVALGHLHRPQFVGNQQHFRYSGSPIPLSFSECTDKKEIRFLEFSQGALISNSAIEIPQARKLFQLVTTSQEMENTLSEFKPEPSNYIHWVELIIKTDDYSGDLRDKIDKLTVDKPFKVIKIITESATSSNGLRISEIINEASLGELLGDPIEVFTKRLDQASIDNVDEREPLLTAFAELYDLVVESQRSCFPPESLKQENIS